MNERSKEIMSEQQQLIYDALKSFNLNVYEDEMTDDDLNPMNFFLIVYGDFKKEEAIGKLRQEIYVVYVSEDNANVETNTIDIISLISKVKAVEFQQTIKERIRKGKTDKFIDRVTLVFSRLVKYE
ncbi:hypothetical protein [Alkalihalobacillus pseudalcaliphilus]|uniref:hypothetical protein n=1 Tax=Alkalihalobacillus pseudalcaliphilus TaxID=79884 RepID=UPI00064DA158|nr:hypothetical protein [Alkalihalobacillus pseudalcaliphilus]KMK77622.1 hypothetical protein AB990_03945 [Alkalihalobacillus pseudalcaliphilus]